MPRKSKGARLWLKPSEIDKATGAVRKKSTWIIRDGSRSFFTGCAPTDHAGAEAALAAYLLDKHDGDRDREKDLPASSVLVTDVLALYATEVVPNHARPWKTDATLQTLGSWWAGKTLADVNGKSCRAYVKFRVGQPWKSARPDKTGNPPRLVTEAGVRRELEDLRAAINHHRHEGYCRDVIEVPLPPKSPSKDRWLTREEAARLLWVCWRTKEVQTRSRKGDKGPGVPTKKYRWRHIARFILVGLYSGTRASAICSAALSKREGSGYVDLENGVFYRRRVGVAETNKRQPSIRMPDRLVAHMKRWAEVRPDGKTISKQFVVEYQGEPIGQINKGFAAAVKAAGLGPDVTPHVLRHTAATWMMQNGAVLWSAAGFLGMSVEMLERVYGHHHPDHQKSASEAVVRKGPGKRAA
jgi:integrase